MTQSTLSADEAEEAHRLIEELKELFEYPDHFSIQYKESSGGSAAIYIDFPLGRIGAKTNSRESYTLQYDPYTDELSIEESIPNSNRMWVLKDQLDNR